MNEAEKDEWEDYVEKSRWNDNLTDFVKEAVREKIERIDGDSPDFNIPEVDANAVDNNGEVLEKIQNLRNDIADLESEVGNAVDAVHAQNGLNPDVSPDVYQALPDTENDAITAEDLAHATGYKHATVRFALENMRRSDGLGVEKLVEVTNESGATTWVRGDGNKVEGYKTNANPYWYKVE